MFEAVVREHQLALSHYALRLTHSAPAAADIVQDVFLSLWERRHSTVAGPAFRSLLYTMVRNRALNVLRNERWIDKSIAPEDTTTVPDYVPADEEAETSALRQHVLRWIGSLPERRAEAFMLSRDQGLSHAEVAQVMGVSRRTVETHVFQALRTLRALYDAHTIEAGPPRGDT